MDDEGLVGSIRDGGSATSVDVTDDSARNKKVLPPLYHYQHRRLQQSPHLQQQPQLPQQQYEQHSVYQQYRQRNQLYQKKYPVEVVAAANVAHAANVAAVVANSAALPSKLQQSLPSPLFMQNVSPSISSSSSSSYNNGVYADAVADRSDSGLGSLRTLNSSDERSGSHSSAFSGSEELHVAATSPLNDQQPMPPSTFNTVPVWRDPNIMQSLNGPIRHVDSVQHQSLFMSNTAQMPEVMLPYQSFHPPPVHASSVHASPVVNQPPVHPPPVHPPSIHLLPVHTQPQSTPMQPVLSAGGGAVLWKPSNVPNTISSSNPTNNNNYYNQLRLNRENAEKEMKKSKQLRSSQSMTVNNSSAPTDNSSNIYGQIDFERLINRHQRIKREHAEKQQAEAAVHQHFEESLKLAQQSRKTNWISNLPTLPKNVQLDPKPEDISNQRLPPLQTTNKQIIDDWKENKNKYAQNMLKTPNGSSSFSSSSSQNANYRPQSIPKLNYDLENISANVNEDSNYNNMISYASFVNSNHANSPSVSSVIVRNQASYKSPSIPTQEVYANSRTPTILTVPAVKMDCNMDQKQTKLMPIHYPKLSSVNTSQPKTDNNLQEPSYPGPSLNTHGRYVLYPPSRHLSNIIDNASYPSLVESRDQATPPPAHLNTMSTSILPKIASAVSLVGDFQREPLDLVMTTNAHAPKIDVPINLYFQNNNSKLYPQDSRDKYGINIITEELDPVKTIMPGKYVDPSQFMLTNDATANLRIVTMPFSSSSTKTIPKSVSSISPVNSFNDLSVISNSKNATITIPKSTSSTETPMYTSANISSRILITTSSTIASTTTTLNTSSNVSITNPTTHNSSPSTPPPVLIPGPYTDMTCGIKTHHHKLKKAWLQRHVWAEDLKEAGVNIDQISPNSFSRIDDTPPILECEVTKKRKKSKSIPENYGNFKALSDMSPSDSDIEPRSANDVTKSTKKRKVSNTTILSENKSATESDRDSDLVVSKKIPPIKIPKKRGRKPKVVVSIPLKKGNNNNGETLFFQSGPCLNAGPKLHKCRECRIFINKKKKDVTTQDEIDNIFCRFYAFRRLFTNKNGQLMNAGFPDPFKDVTIDDLNLWMPNSNSPPSTLDIDVAKKVLIEAGRQFCYLVKEENKALTLSPFSQDKPIAWKKAANGVREMCDVCLTTIFNYHWACAKCGFGVCIDCVKARLNGTAIASNAATMTKKDLREKDKFRWMTCNNKNNHDVEQLMLTQIVAGDSMNIVFSNLHQICIQQNIQLECGCPDHPFPQSQGDIHSDDDDEDELNSNKTENSAEFSKKNNTIQNNPVEANANENLVNRQENVQLNSSRRNTLKYFIRKKNIYLKTIPREPLPPRVMTLAQSREFFPDNPHVWSCDGRLLRLLDPEDPTNCYLFQEQWKRGQPVMISDVSKSLNPNLWNPNSFIRDFGQYTNDLIDCSTGYLIKGKTIKQFWDGFEDETKRLKSSDGKKMLLKLKDWPVATDFSEILPERFDDLMRALPLKDYTQREGKLNLASRLPTCFVRPDLGPKMYSAYGNAGHHDPSKHMLSTTNLHLDVSDVVNVMVFVAITRNSSHTYDKDESANDWHLKEVYRAVDEAGCDMASRRRAREPKEFPGAVWHIYHACDADSIRDLLNKVSAERGKPLESNHDPIHDKLSYLDADLRTRLYNEYGVQGYAVLQCLGDAIFIPAGAPHQVRNLHNCIKVAEDFVSPENVSQCFRLMNEFHNLPYSQYNHEDKLQIKNIIYHAIKDSLSVLLHESQQEEQA